MRCRVLLPVAVLTSLAASAFAADAPTPPTRVRGAIVSVDAKTISVRRADGTTVTAYFPPNVKVAAVEARSFQDIKQTDFIGITAVPGPHDSLVAQEIHILPKVGLHEGSYPWEHTPNESSASNSMTNGTVLAMKDAPPNATMTNATVDRSQDMQLKVTYKGAKMVDGKCVGHASKATHKPCTGVANVTVLHETPIVAVVPATVSDAKPGLSVFLNVKEKPKQKWQVTWIVVEKNGVKPVW